MERERITSTLYHEGTSIGEVYVYPQREDAHMMGNISERISISSFSSPSKRCPPLAVLHSITSNGVCLKMEPKEGECEDDQAKLVSLYNACLQEAKTAIVQIGRDELHLVAMVSRVRHKQVPCFWGFCVGSGLYGSCLGMLDLRCLAIVFDLDETLVVAHTLRSFEDRIEVLNWKKLGEVDPQRVSGISAEIKRYRDDQEILKQYINSDQVFDNGRYIKARSEIVHLPSDNPRPPLPCVRPIIRLPERNIILTRINPNIRDTSVLVRMRPGWEELRNYLIANGRKRFEVFICTMSERDYALEMWRLLDPEGSLISPSDLGHRVVCVKPSLRKSLVNVFRNGVCHPKIAMVVDDRLNVWEDIDQPRVHVVQAFLPYYDPLAETSNPVTALRFAKNVAGSVRGGFFKDFDMGLLQKMAEVFYENDVTNLPSTVDVCKYMDQNLIPNFGPASVFFDNQNPELSVRPLQQEQLVVTESCAETQPSEKVLEHSLGVSPIESSNSLLVGSESSTDRASLVESSTYLTVSSAPSTNSSPGREEGEIPESELDADTRRRLLILKHGQDPGQRNFISYDPPLLRSMADNKLPSNHQLVGMVGGEVNVGSLFKQTSEGLALGSESRSFDALHIKKDPFYCGPENLLLPNTNTSPFIRQLHRQGLLGDHIQNLCGFSSFSGKHIPQPDTGRFGGCDVHNGWVGKQSIDLQLSMGFNNVPKENDRPVTSISGLSKCVNPAHVNQYTENVNREKDDDQTSRETIISMGSMGVPCSDDIDFVSISDQMTVSKQIKDDFSKGSGSYDPVVALNELCTSESLSLDFQNECSISGGNVEYSAQVKVGGQILAKSTCPSLEAAKLQAAKEALQKFKAKINAQGQKRLNSSRMVPGQSNKRIKPEGLLPVSP